MKSNAGKCHLKWGKDLYMSKFCFIFFSKKLCKYLNYYNFMYDCEG